jgi:replicative DNA helicase
MSDGPVSIEAEQQVLGAILSAIDTNEAENRASVVLDHGGADIFADPAHAALFREIVRRQKEGMAHDAASLKGWAAAHPGVSQLGSDYLVRVTLSSVATGQLPKHCEHLSDALSKRRLLDAMNEAKAQITKSEDTAEVIAGRLEAALSAAATPSSRRPVSMMAATHKAISDLMSARQGKDGALHTGIASLDRLFSGFWPGELVLLGGRPSMGKTALALSIALNAARAGHGVGIFSLEMNPDQMAIRALAEQTSHLGKAVAYESIRRGDVHDEQMPTLVEAARTVGDLPIQFLSREFADLGALYSGATKVNKMLGGNMKLLVVDYVQLIKSDARSRFEQITDISIALKALAGKLQVPILALSQLSRQVESRDDKRPMLSDLRESGQLEQDADAVMFAYRDEYYVERAKPTDGDVEKMEKWEHAMNRVRHRLEVIVAKQRQGPIGTAHMRCNPAQNLIWEDNLCL